MWHWSEAGFGLSTRYMLQDQGRRQQRTVAVVAKLTALIVQCISPAHNEPRTGEPVASVAARPSMDSCARSRLRSRSCASARALIAARCVASAYVMHSIVTFMYRGRRQQMEVGRVQVAQPQLRLRPRAHCRPLRRVGLREAFIMHCG